MSVIKVHKKKVNFTIIDNTGIKDKRLSWKAKGLLCYLLSLPEDWQIYMSELKENCSDGRDSTSAGFAELVEFGYATKEKIHAEKGQFKYNYTVFEVPQYENHDGKSVVADSEKTDSPQRQNRSRLNRNGKPATTKEDKSSYTEKERIEEESTEAPAQKTFELQDEKEKAAEPQAAQPYLNANAQKTYKSHLEIYNTLVLFWKANPEYTETINLMIEPLGMGSQFPNKRKAFFDHVENIFCTSIKKNHKTPLSAFELHDMIVQKIAYAKAELSELKPLGGKEEAKEKKMAEIKNKPFISEEEESIIVAYCQDRTGYSYTTSKEFRECQDIKAQRMYLQAKSNIENTKKYLINKNLIAA